MLQDDSNGETFEIIDKKTEELSLAADRAESLSSMSSSTSLLPSPGVSLASVPSATGNLLSNVQPPSALPSFVMSQPIIAPVAIRPPQMQGAGENPALASGGVSRAPLVPAAVAPDSDIFGPTQFSAAIPPSKGVPLGNVPLKEALPTDDSGGILGWMKGAVSSGGLLSKMAERAKCSVDSMITTLDPQMREFIHSGGDIDVVVASGQEAKISAVREAFQSVFGKATVGGLAVQATNIAPQPVGFAAGVKAAEERIHLALKGLEQQLMPVVAIENFLLEVGEDKWYDLGVLILNDPKRQITLKTFTQMTPVPATLVALAQEDTPNDYPLKWSGYSVTIDSLMAKNLQVSPQEWHQTATGVSRREIILLAARTLANLYKHCLS